MVIPDLTSNPGKNLSFNHLRHISFNAHVMKEHNVFSYLYFILHVMNKSGNECTGVERYVKLMVALDNPSFFPVSKCLAFEKQGY